jgi:hypothetical protein
MSRLQAIENALTSINPAAFQELCDSFLALRNSNYSAFSRTGSQSGKQKTIKGTPDTFLLLPNGKFIFVEYSTNVTAGISKLEGDIKKCLNIAKTGIPINQIAEIILCINFNLKLDEAQALKDILVNSRIALTIYSLDSLAIELQLNHRDLSHHYLGLPLDTGQIVSIENFIAEYNRASKGISTPLDNTFLHREEELKELKESILKKDFIILTGAPGIGKTKLALEGIKSFLSDNLSFGAYCISYKNHTLLEDLYQYFDPEKDYLLFVDDANRIDAFSQITGFYKAMRKGKLKILITVRDYAFQEIGILCHEFSPIRLDLGRISDAQIVDIIKADPFDILNPEYHKLIERIADGNPRLAIMTALLAKAEQNIYALSDVSDLFENYFSTFIRDDGEFAKALNIRCLGLISFFHTIPYKNREIVSSILDNFEMDYFEFIETIDKLDKLELAEIQFDHVKIPEQNLSTYFFYKAFINDNLLSFQTLLDKYFDSNSNRFRDCVIPANNTFGHEKVMLKLQPDLKMHWKKIKNDEEKAFKFLTTFWYYLRTETLEFIFIIINELPDPVLTNYEVTYENNAFSYNKNNVLELLSEFLGFTANLKDVTELAFEYVRKKPNHLPELIHKIRECLTFDVEDEKFGFERQNILFNILLERLSQGDALYSIAFYELSKTFLSFKFRHTKGGRNHSFYWYEYPIPYTPPILQFRESIWRAVDNNFVKYPDYSFNLLLNYTNISPDVIKEIMKFDVQFLVVIIDTHLNPKSFEHCKYVQDQIRWCKRNSVEHTRLSSLSSKFTNAIYETYVKIDWDRFRDKEVFEYTDFKEYDRLKEAEIRTSFIFTETDHIKSFFKDFVYLKTTAKNQWNYNKTLDLIIDENCERNFAVGCKLLMEIIEDNNDIYFVPRITFRNHLNTVEKTQKIWAIIQRGEFKHKELWELSFYDYLDDSLLNAEYVKHLVNTMGNMKDQNTIHFDRLERFLRIEPNLFQIILRQIVEKNTHDGVYLQVWMDFFSTHFNQLGNDIELIKMAYLQQDKIHNHFDYEGKGFLNILKRDIRFLLEFIISLYSVKKFGLSNDHRDLGFIWQVDNIEPVLIEVFDLIIQKEPYFGINDHYCNSFFRNLHGKERERAKAFLIDYCRTNFADPDKMNVVVEIARHAMRELFEEILLLFISLNQDKEVFSKIWWRGNGTSGSGNVILADIEAADWRNILAIVEKSTVGIQLIPIKKYLNDQIEKCLRMGDFERQQRFLERY